MVSCRPACTRPTWRNILALAASFPAQDTATPTGWPLLRALRGEVVAGEEMTFHRADGSRGTLRASAAPIRDDQQRIVAAVTTWFDISDRKRLEDKLQVLAEAGAALGSSLDYEATLGQLAQLVVPRLADWCTIHMANEDGTLRPLTVAHADSARAEWASPILHRLRPNPSNPRGLYQVLRTGQPELTAEITDEMLRHSHSDPEFVEILRQLGLRSSMIVPLCAWGRTLGVLTFLTAESRARYTEDDLALAQELAHRAALAVDNARLYGELRRGGPAQGRIPGHAGTRAAQPAVADPQCPARAQATHRRRFRRRTPDGHDGTPGQPHGPSGR